MKTFFISLIVLIILLSGIRIYSYFLNTTITELQESINVISMYSYDKNWKQCTRETETLINLWNKAEPVLSMFNDHEDVDNIKLSIVELKESVANKNYEHITTALEETKVLLERLSKNETLSLENILGLAHFDIRCHNML